MSDGLELLQKILKIRKEKQEEEYRKRVRIRTGVDFWDEKAAPIQTTQRTYEKKGFQAYLNKAISSKAYQTMVREGIAPQLQDKNIWGVLSAQFGFPLKKVFSAGMAFPRGLSAVYAMTPEKKLPWLETKEYKPGEVVNLKDYISRRGASPIQAFKESKKETTELYKGYPSSGEVLKEAAKSFFNRPGAIYKDYDWIKALTEKHPESWAAKPFGWAEDTDDWVKGTNWFQKFASGVVGTPFGMAGLTLDIVTDPITYITGGVGKGANMGVKATKDIVSKSGQVVIKKGSPTALRSTARIMLKGGWDDALREGKSAFTLIRNYARGGLGVTDDQAFKAMMKLGVPIKNTKHLRKWISILGDVPDEAVEGIIRKKVTEGLVTNMFKNMDTPMAKSLVDYGGLKIAEKTIIPGYKFQSMEGAMKALQKKPVVGTLSRMFTTGAGIPSEFLPAKAYVESAMRARGAGGAEMIAKMFKGLNKTSINKIDDFLGYSGDIAKYTKQLDDLYKTPISKIKNWDKHLAKISDLEKYILKLKNKLPKLTGKETVVKNIYKQRFLKGFLEKEELKWGAKYKPLEEYFHPRIVPGSIKGDMRTWAKSVLGAERQPFQYGKKLTFTQLKALQKAGKLKLKTLPESAIKRIAESVTGVGRKQMLNEVKGFGSLTKQPGYIKSTLPELKGWYFPEEVVTPMERTTKAFFGEEAVRTTARVYDNIHTVWKRWALATPGFHLRNFYSDCWSGWMQYGMEYFNPKYWKDAAVIKASGRFKLHKLINIGERGTAYSDDLYRTMTKSGEISGGFYAGEALTRRPVERLVSKLDPSIWSTKGGAIREDMGRIVAGLIERNHGSNNMMAAFGVKRVFYDYFDLTKTEKNIMKRLMPFYCVDNKTEALTKDGWKKYNELKINDEILTLNIDNNISEWKKIDGIFIDNYNGEMYSLEQQLISAVVTPDHKWAVKNSWKNVIRLKETKDLNKSDKIPLCAENIDLQKEKIYSDDFIRLIGWVITEGHYKNCRGYTIEISQSRTANPKNILEIENTLKRLKARYHEFNAGISKKIHYFGLTGDYAKKIRKILPNKILTIGFILSLTKEQIDLLLEILVKGDGSYSYDNIVLQTNNKKFADNIQYMLSIAGYVSFIKKRIFNQGHLGGDTYLITIRLRKNAKITGTKINKIIYNGIIWCPHTVNETWYARRNGRGYFTGNTWMRKNIARQVELMITRSGKYAAIPKVKTYLESIAEKPEGYETYKPEYFKELQTILTKAKTKEGYPLALWPNLPFGDVSKLGTNLPSEILNSISPILKAPLEILFNRSSFLGNELRLGEYREAPQWIKSSLGHLPNSFLKQIGMEKDEKTGKMVISNLASYLLSQFPPFSTATRLAPADELPKTPYDWLSVMGGIKFFPYQEKREKERYQKQWIEEFKDFSEYKEKLTREETIGLTDIKTGLRFMYDQEVDKKYTDKITEAENLNKMGKLLGGTAGRIFKNRAKKLLEDYYTDLDKAKGKDIEKLYELLLEMGMKPDDNDIRQAIKDRLELRAKELKNK